MTLPNIPFLTEIAKVQEQIFLPFVVKLGRLQEQLSMDIGVESTANLEPGFLAAYKKSRDYTLTSFKAMQAMYQAACYVVRADIPGDYVECGVWKGGSSMIAALAFLHLNNTARQMYLYDTYEGMPSLGKHDGDLGTGQFQFLMNVNAGIRGGHAGVFYAAIQEVRQNMHSTGYPQEKIFLVKGLVEQTIPLQAPEQISLLHLDSDLYESTYHELTHLYPRLSKGGALIIDDYGNWKGSRKATDQYFQENSITMLLTPIGNDGARIGIKT